MPRISKYFELLGMVRLEDRTSSKNNLGIGRACSLQRNFCSELRSCRSAAFTFHPSVALISKVPELPDQ